MKLVIASTAIALGLSVSALAAEPGTDHSQHQQHQQQAKPSAPQQSQPGAARAAHQEHMHHHQGIGHGMKMEGCCCSKKDASDQMSCDDKTAPPADQSEGHSKH